MKNKTFNPKIEDIYNNLSEAQKNTYIKKYNIQNIIALTLTSILVAMDIVGLVLLLCINEEVPAFAILLVVFMLICCGGIMFISIKALNSSNEVKVKKHIENLEKRKTNLANNYGSQNQSFLDKYFLKQEQQKLNIEEIQYVNNYVISFLKNNDLITICKNFMQDSNLPFQYLELVFVPIIAPTNFDTIGVYLAPANSYSFKYPDELEVENSPFIQTLKEFKEDIIFVDEVFLLVATVVRRAGLANSYKYDLKGKNLLIEELFDKFNKTREMFNTLCNQGIITGEKNIYKYYAFIFILYYLDKMRFTEITKQVLNEYHISDALSTKELIEVCYSKELDESTIESLIVYVECYRRNNKPLINVLTKELEPVVNATINNIKEKEKIERLLSGNFVSKHKYSIAQIDLMNGAEFEKFIAILFNGLGYQAENTKLSGDQGVDVIAKKGDKIIAIQAKHYNQAVGNHAIMEVVAGAKFYNATICYVVTNNYFTKSAKELAATNNVILWDRDKLIEKLSEI